MAVGDFNVDPNTIWNAKGPIPAGHPRRCQAVKRRSGGIQCGQRAAIGFPYCRFHGGAQRKIQHNGRGSMSYGKWLGPKLKEQLAEIAGESEKRMLLAEEIDLMRLSAVKSIQLWEFALDPENAEKVTDDQRVRATHLMRDSITQVSEMISKAAKITALMKDQVPVSQIDNIVVQMTRILDSELGEQPELMKRIAARMKEIKTNASGPTVTISVD